MLIGFVETLGPFLWRSTVLIGAAYLANATLFRRCPAHRNTTLLVVLFVCPIIWFTAAPGFEMPVWTARAPAAQTAPPPSVEPVFQDLAAISRQCNRPGTWISGRLAPEHESVSSAFPWNRLAAMGWLAGLALMLIRYGIHHIRLKRLLIHARPILEGPLRQRFDRLLCSLGASSRIRLIEISGLFGPAAAGVFHPAVLLPADLVKEQNLIHEETLAHEILHHRRRDLHFHWITMAVRALFWFQPLVHLAARSLSIERERAIDLLVISKLGNPKGYIDQLHDTVRRAASGRPKIAQATAFLGTRASLIRRRIEMLLDNKRFRTSRRPTLFALSTLSVFLVTALFLAIGSCAGPETEKNAGDSVDRTAVLGTKEEGLYKLVWGFDKVSEVKMLPMDMLGSPSEASYMKKLDPAEWSFDRERQNLRLLDPVDLEKHALVAYGKEASPRIWTLLSIIGKKDSIEFDPGSVEIKHDDRLLVLGKDFEIDPKTGFLRFLTVEKPLSEVKDRMTIQFKPDPDEPNYSLGITVGKSDPMKHGEDRLQQVRDRLKQKMASDGYGALAYTWKTSDPLVFMPKRPMKNDEFVLSIRQRDSSDSRRTLERDKDYRFDESLQTIVFTSSGIYDPEKQVLIAWGNPEDNCTYQFPGPIKKGSIQYIYEGEHLEEGKGYIVDYRRNRVTLVDRAFNDIVSGPRGVSETVFKHALTAGDWKIRNYPEDK